jgi:hypothetical protein
VYVAGFERGVRPIGDWSMSITLSRNSMPNMKSNFPARVFAPLSSAASALYTTSLTKEDLPLPETPVTAVIIPSGIEIVRFLRLFSPAPVIVKALPLPFLLERGTGIFLEPLRYFPVMEFSHDIISSAVPAHTISPP